MAIGTYLLLGIIALVSLVFIVGLLLPKVRTETRQIILNDVPEQVYRVVIDNNDWAYRSSLSDLEIIEKKGDFEVWCETSKNGSRIRFETKEKIPYSFYSFDMEGDIFTGYWTAEFEPVEDNKTLFVATEYIRIKNPFVKALSYLFFDIGKLMEEYQSDLKTKVEERPQ